MAKTKVIAQPNQMEPRPVGRPPKISDIRVEFAEALGESPVRIEATSRDVDAKIKDLKDNGYTIKRGGYTIILTTGAIQRITIRER